MKNLLYVIPILFVGILSALQPLPASAAGSSPEENIIISEINWAGSELSNADEWLELYNEGSSAVDLGGWILAGVATGGEAIALPEGTVIDTGSTLLISNFNLESTRTTLNVVPSLMTSSLSLRNTSLDVKLAMPNGLVVDEVSYSSPEFGSSSPKASMERDLSDKSWKTASISLGLSDQSQLGTPGYIAIASDNDNVESNCIPTTVTPEFEFVMTNLYEENETATQDSDLTEDPLLDQQENVPDASGGSDGDDSTVQGGGTDVHQIIAVAQLDQSDGDPEPDSDTTPTSAAEVDSISGVVTALPGTFGEQIAFIEGIELYFYHADWPTLKIGDVVTVQGVFSESRGEERIKIAFADDIRIIDHQDLEPQVLTIAEAQSIVPGTLVTIEADILERDGDKLRVSDDSGELTVVAQSKTNVSWAVLSESRVRVTGVIRHLDGEIRLYPRSMTDVKSISITSEETEGLSGCTGASAAIIQNAGPGPWLGSGLVAASLGAIAYWYMKKRKEDGLSLNPLTA